MAMFADHRLARESWDISNYYFSPEAAKECSSMLTPYSPVPCTPPSRDAAVLLVGHANAWELLPKADDHEKYLKAT